jgi:DNA-binding transcriptional LysR family regulator
MSIELRHLRYFLAVADTLHFGQAAERGMSQPPLSQQIRQLEDLIGARLFVRSHRRVQLTPAGELLQERARAIVQQVETAVDEVQRAQRGEQGELHIGLTRATPLSPQIPRSILPTASSTRRCGCS